MKLCTCLRCSFTILEPRRTSRMDPDVRNYSFEADVNEPTFKFIIDQ